ncbi:MAG: nucleotidyltransferase family protein [Alphaproteobacteria bacterium]
MKNWRRIAVGPETPILSVIQVIEAESAQFALVVGDDGRLLGTVTDGDFRRGILHGIPLDSPVTGIMNDSPRVGTRDTDRSDVLAVMRADQIRHMPIVDDAGCVVGLETLDELIAPKRRDNWVVLMAGGAGTRLRPLTHDTPKPLLEVGGRPILETIVRNFVDHGFHEFFISVNYKADRVSEHFGDGSRLGAHIRYLREESSLGTAGALSLLPERPQHPLVVMNGDILTNIDFPRILDFHSEHDAAATMCVREHDFHIPFGVVEMNVHKFLSIKEKPVQRFFVNAGIYLINPEVLDFLPRSEPLDMPVLFERAKERLGNVFVFPIREYWLDIGQADDFARANHDYTVFFEA